MRYQACRPCSRATAAFPTSPLSVSLELPLSSPAHLIFPSLPTMPPRAAFSSRCWPRRDMREVPATPTSWSPCMSGLAACPRVRWVWIALLHDPARVVCLLAFHRQSSVSGQHSTREATIKPIQSHRGRSKLITACVMEGLLVPSLSFSNSKHSHYGLSLARQTNSLALRGLYRWP